MRCAVRGICFRGGLSVGRRNPWAVVKETLGIDGERKGVGDGKEAMYCNRAGGGKRKPDEERRGETIYDAVR